MDLQALAEKTRIPVRRLRHCLDQDLIPGFKIEIADNLAGRPRRFHEDVGFVIACAATLIDAGILRTTVRIFMGGLGLVELPRTNQLAILAFFEQRARGVAELGDNTNMRIIFRGRGEPIDTGWVHPGNPARLDKNYQPLTKVSLDIGAVGQRVFGWPRRAEQHG